MEQAPEDPAPKKITVRRHPFNLLYILLIVWVFILAKDYFSIPKNIKAVPYSEFTTLLSQDKLAEVDLAKDHLTATLKTPDEQGNKEVAALRVEDPNLVSTLQSKNVKFSEIPEGGFLADMLAWTLPIFFMAAIWWFFLRRFGQMRGDFLSVGKSKARVYVERGLSVRFSDVAGVEEAKEELSEVVNFLKDPAKYSRLGGRMPKGVLLVGPPGTGKTLLARAVAGEANVAFFSINGSEFVEMFVGVGAARVRDLFVQAREQAPCIIFVDELDALGKARGLSAIGGAPHDEKEQTLNQLLAEMDGFDSSQGLILLGATNRPEVLDPALLRSGRFDRQILVDKPDKNGREQILKVHIRGIKMDPEVKLEVIASLTAGFSGADLANLANEAALIATRRGADKVELADFTEGIERIVAGLERKNRLLNPEEKRRVAFHEMGHAVVALALGQGEAVHKISVIPRGIGALGYTFRRPIEDRYLMTRDELHNKMAILLGGRASEQIFFDDISTGASDDLDKATEIARAMIAQFGMSTEIGLATCETEPAALLGTGEVMKTNNYSEQTAQLIDQEVKKFLDQALDAAVGVLKKYKHLVREGAEKLLVQETLNEEEIKVLWQKGHKVLKKA